MSLINSFSKYFSSSSQVPQQLTPADQMMAYVVSLVKDTTTIASLMEKYNAALRIHDSSERDEAYIPLYIAFEKYITENKAPLVEEISKPHLRERIRTEFPIQDLPIPVRIFFLSELERAVYFFELCTQPLFTYIVQNIGLTELQERIMRDTQKTVVHGVVVDSAGIHFSSILPQITHLPLEEVLPACRILYAGLYQQVSSYIGEAYAQKIVTDSFTKLKKEYDYDLISRFLDMVPQDLLPEERLEILSREELASQVRQRTRELEEAKISLEQRVAERTKELLQERARLQASITSLTIGFIIVDAGKKVQEINPAAHRILGHASTEHTDTLDVMRKQFVQAVPIDASLESSLTQRKSITLPEVTYGAQILRLQFTPILLPDAAGEEVLGVVLLLEDITEAKAIERSKDEFFSIASHELRTPLTAIRGNTALIRDYYSEKISDPDLKEMIADINESSERMIKIVNDFLDMSRLEQGRIKFKKEDFALYPLVEQTVEELHPLVAQKHLELHVEQAVSDLYVKADQSFVKEVVTNLVANAIKFTQEGKITIRITIEAAMVKIIVEDTGPGISQANLHLLFRKFQQAGDDIYRRDVTQGTGLGLYISRLLAEGMGGTITLEKSEVGKGSIFSLTLPLSETTSVE